MITDKDRNDFIILLKQEMNGLQKSECFEGVTRHFVNKKVVPENYVRDFIIVSLYHREIIMGNSLDEFKIKMAQRFGVSKALVKYIISKKKR